ncbi:hypothetical protein, partial [Thiolapillus sp.]|uniref:hypothetical protein n=1 Tax=Thiolapillus sp. TaxID=2017437 RepID=UPI003AF5128E
EKPYVTVCCIKKKWSSVRRCTSSVPIFANGALSGAFGYLFGSAMAANDDSYGQNEMAMISEDKWGVGFRVIIFPKRAILYSEPARY